MAKKGLSELKEVKRKLEKQEKAAAEQAVVVEVPIPAPVPEEEILPGFAFSAQDFNWHEATKHLYEAKRLTDERDHAYEVIARLSTLRTARNKLVDVAIQRFPEYAKHLQFKKEREDAIREHEVSGAKVMALPYENEINHHLAETKRIIKQFEALQFGAIDAEIKKLEAEENASRAIISKDYSDLKKAELKGKKVVVPAVKQQPAVRQ